MPPLLPILAFEPTLAIAGAAATGIPIAIHLLSRWKRRPQVWGAMRFILEAYRRHKRRLQLEQLLLLAVRCLILALLGLALAGPTLGQWAGGLGLGTSERLVCIVIDDSLSSRAAEGAAVPDAEPVTRFEQLRAMALQTVDGLSPSDRVAVWRVSRPGEAVLTPPTYDRQGARDALRKIEPRFSRSDLLSTLTLVSQELAQAQLPAERTFVVVLSDFATGAVPMEGGNPPKELASIGQRARLMVNRPLPAVPNTQIASLVPRRHVVLAEGQSPAAASLELRLRRFAGEGSEQLTTVRVEVFGPDLLERVATAERQHRWSPGQTEATVSLDVNIPRGSTQPGQSVGELRIVRARIDSDALEPDNERLAVIEVRQRLRVAIVDDENRATASGQEWSPGRWLSIALSPRLDQSLGGVETVTLSPTLLDGEALSRVDAVIVLRPDLLEIGGWQALRRATERGGMLWVMPPEGDAPAVWAAALREQLGLPWTVAMDPVAAQQDDVTDTDDAWPLDTEQPAPEPLRLLAGHFTDLLAPVRVMRRLDVSVENPSDVVWLRTRDGAPVLLSSPLGDGRVLLLTTALNSRWTNLPTKPLFAPLLHEALRGVVGSTGSRVRLAGVVCGDAPPLGAEWEQAQEMQRLESQPGGPQDAPADSDLERSAVLLRRTDAGVTTAGPLHAPGVYAPSPAGPVRLPVNADADAGDTRAIDAQQLADWLSTVGKWEWIEPANANRALAAQIAPPSLAWPLLWAVLALVVFETLLARWFSHAGVQRPSLFVRLVRHLHGGGA